MEKTVRRNIMAINEDWRIFKRILKRDLALDRKSGRRRIVLSGWRCHLAGDELLVKTTSEVVPRSDLLSRGLM